jgi:multiple sugar transport system substrate-binding protein
MNKFKNRKENILNKILLVLLVSLLVFGFAITAIAKVELSYFTHTSIQVEGLEPGVYEQRLIDEFEKLYPEVNIELEVIPYAGDTGKVEFSIAAGTPPDILACDIQNLVKYANAGILLDFNDILTKEDLADFYPFAIEGSTVNGKMYYYPMGVRAGAMIIDRTLAKEWGVFDWLPFNREDRSWTAEEFAHFIQKVNELNKGYGWCFWYADNTAHHHLNMMLIQGFGGKPFIFENGKFKCIINSPEAIEGIKFYLDLYKKYPNAIPQGAESIGVGDMDNLFLNKKSLAEPASINQVIREKKGDVAYTGFDQRLLPYPAKKGLSNGVPLDWCGYVVFDNKDVEKAKYAKLFVKYFVENAPNILEANFNSSPVRKSQLLPFQQFKDDPEVQYALNVLTKFGKDFGISCPVYSQWRELLQIHMQGVFTGELTVEECLKLVEDKTNQLLDEYYVK